MVKSICFVLVAFWAVAVFSSGALATRCTELCEGRCAISEEICKMTSKSDEVCTAEFTACIPLCGPDCNCIHTCERECQTTANECKEGQQNVLYHAFCESKQMMCQTYCGVYCPSSKLYKKFQSVIGKEEDTF